MFIKELKEYLEKDLISMDFGYMPAHRVIKK
jgi:hypothetical protein